MNIRIATILLSTSSGLAVAQQGGVCAGAIALTCHNRADAVLTSGVTYADYMNGLQVLNDCPVPCLSDVKIADMCARMKTICDGMGLACRGYPTECVYINPGRPTEPDCIPSMTHVKDKTMCDQCCNKQGCYVSYDDPNCPPGSYCLGNACI